MISIVGPDNSVEYPLPVQTGELQSIIDRWYANGEFAELYNPEQYRPTGRVLTPVLGPPGPPPRIGSLYWPVVGASRYAYGLFLLDEYTLGSLRSQFATGYLLDENGDPILDENGNPIIAETVDPPFVNLLFRDAPDDPSETPRSVGVFMLNARPLVRTSDGALTTQDDPRQPVDAWIATFVDPRYFIIPHSAARPQGGTEFGDYVQWVNETGVYGLIGPAGSYNLGAQAGGPLTAALMDPVDAAYLSPSFRWDDPYIVGRSVAWLIDCAAAAIGARIVVVPADGGYWRLQYPTTVNKEALTDAHAANLDRHVWGGLITEADIEGSLPLYLFTRFETDEDHEPVTYRVELPTGSVSGMGVFGNAGTWLDPYVSTGLNDNQADREALAEQWAADWLAWEYSPLDAAYAGFVEAPPSGFLWAFEYYHDAGRAYTRFYRSPPRVGLLLPAANPRPADCVDSRILSPNPSSTDAVVSLTDNNTWHTVYPTDPLFFDFYQAGRYAIQGQITFTVSDFTGAGTDGRGTVRARLYDLLADRPVPGSDLLIYAGRYGAYDTRHLSLLYDVTTDGTRIGLQAQRSAPIGTSVSWGTTTVRANQLSYHLVCRADPTEDTGSGGCDPIAGWDGPGWYCIWNGTACEPAELMEADACDTAISICGGPYVDEAAAEAACGTAASCSGTCEWVSFYDEIAGWTWTYTGGGTCTGRSCVCIAPVGFPDGEGQTTTTNCTDL